MSETISFFAIANADLAHGATVRAGDRVRCPTCGQPHALYGAGPLLFYDCGEASYLAGIDGHLIDAGEVSDRDESRSWPRHRAQPADPPDAPCRGDRGVTVLRPPRHSWPG